jgi:hypothetical protein
MSTKPMIVNLTFRVEFAYHRSPEELAQLVTKIKALVDGFNAEVEIEEVKEIKETA